MKKKADRRKTATKEAKIPKTHEAARVRRRSCRLKNKSAATGSNLEDLRAEQRKQQQSGESLVTPIIVRKGVSSNDFRIFAKDISKRLENEGKRYAFQKKDITKEDILKVRDYDVSNKQLPPSRPLTPASSEATRPPRDIEPQLEESDQSIPAANEESSSSATTATTTSYDNTDESASPHGETSRNSANSHPFSEISSAEQTEEQSMSEPEQSSTNVEESPPTQVNQTSNDELQNNNGVAGLTSQSAHDEDITANLPAYTPVEKHPGSTYNNLEPEEFVDLIEQVYESMVTWRKNLFLLPSGNAGKNFVRLLADWLGKYNVGSSFQGIAIKVVMILPNLLLQKPSGTSKAKEHTKVLTDRLQLWSEGKIRELLRDCHQIQKKLKSSRKRSMDDIHRIFSNLVMEGKIGPALKFLDETVDNAVLTPNEEVINKLKQLHPPSSEINTRSVLIQGPIPESICPSTFSEINEEQILKAAKQVKGSGGPSLLDA